jgi:hypothetical protein
MIVTFKIVASLTDDSRGVIYNCNVLEQATGFEPPKTKRMNMNEWTFVQRSGLWSRSYL